MDLAKLHHDVLRALSKLDFSDIWPGFTPLRFALFTDEACCFDGRYVEKTDAFCANTSIVYEGEQIATWYVAEEPDLPVLTSKIVHEMFHGFQTQRGWDCWPNELEALYRYEYSAENLCLKLRENELMLALLRRFDGASFRELLSLRKMRSERYPYAFSYEIRAEEIEGTANYVEWQALRQLDERKAAAFTERMGAMVAAPERLFPIRISCYYTGALMIAALRSAGLYSFDPPERPALLSILKDADLSDGSFPGKDACLRRVSDAVDEYRQSSESIVRTALERNEIVLSGPLRLVSVNIYDARCFGGYLTSTHFLMYRDDEGEKLISGDFVIRMRDEATIETVYRWR